MLNYSSIILISFLSLNLIVGLYYGRGVTTLKDYALGNRNFNTATLVSTIIATWVGGQWLFIILQEVYTTGISFTIASCGMVAQFIMLAYFIVPRMGEFLGNISIAEAMGELYGKNVRIIASICGSIVALGFVGVQFKAFGNIFKYFLEIPINTAIIISAMIVILYSAFGGIRAVAITDVMQFFTFGVLIPVLAVIIWLDVRNLPNFTLEEISKIPIYNWRECVGIDNPKFWKLISSFTLFLWPGFTPPFFQRIAIGRSISQVKTAFYFASLVLLLILLGMSWIGFLIYNINPNLEPSDLVYYVLDNYGDGGIKIFVLISIVAMCMSTADSELNSVAVLLSHDFCKPLKIGLENELLQSKFLAVALGVCSIFFAISEMGMLELVLMIQSFYAPIIGVPFLLAVLGFRSTEIPILIGIVAGTITVVIWNIFFTKSTGLAGFLPGSLINMVFFISIHYLLGQKGGWVGVKQQSLIDNKKIEQYYKFKNLITNIKIFNFITFCKNNTPKRELTYSTFGTFGIITGICAMHALSKAISANIRELMVFYEFMLMISVSFLIYPLWPQSLKQGKFVHVFWNVSIFFSLVFCSAFFLLLTNFSHLQFIIFTVNIIAIGLLIRWQSALIMLGFGVLIALVFYKVFTGNDYVETSADASMLAIYSFILISTLVLSFVMPSQLHQNKTEEAVMHLDERISEQAKELKKLNELKYEFLRNIEHEINTPITGILSLGQTLYDNYDKFSDAQIKSGLSVIAKSSEVFDRVVKNLFDLSKLTSLFYKLNKKKIDLSGLIFNRLNICKKIYLDNKELEFYTKIEPNILVNCDIHYITSTIDNLIINAISYNQSGKIILTLKTLSQNEIEFSISDEGFGIPPNELIDIFGAFVVSTKTKTPAGGRGLGLAICKKVIEGHGGKIWAENNKDKGVSFIFVIPIEKVTKSVKNIVTRKDKKLINKKENILA